MKNIFNGVIWGKSNKFNGLIALLVVGAIALGCTCGKDFKLGQQSNSNSENTVANKGDSPLGKDSPFSRNTSKDTSGDTNSSDDTDSNYTKADASKKEIPSDAEMQEIIKTTLLDFNDALQQRDFTDFHGKISRVWAKQTTPEKLKQGFQMFIDGQTDISEIDSLKATFTSAPKIVKNLGYDMLDVKGEYPTSGVRTTFELQYVGEKKDWKLTAIKVYAKVKK